MAIALTKIGQQSVTSVSKEYGIPYATLYRHWKSKSSERKLGRFVPVSTNAEEIELKNYLIYMDTLIFGLTRDDFLKLSFDYSQANQIKHPFKNGRAGDDWLAKFGTRHPDITFRTPEPTSIARTIGFNRPQIERFYTVLGEVLEKHKFPATSIYNMDETRLMSNSNKPPKIFTARGKKQVGIIASSERGQLTTVTTYVVTLRQGHLSHSIFFSLERECKKG
ncbi:hypothetical protein QE152_g40794 [Popillia japonica]|uniref:HTH psq-type domain-containing protein n=1 Tax=Popillia japonica TaxID=7064 RepID=A0AAW1HF78_POPJA